ncbi:MAG: flagellar basal body rod protein FlgC [Arenimonas sp.]
MSIDAIMEASRAGLAYERLRMEAASKNIAAANMPLAPNASPVRSEVLNKSQGFGKYVAGNLVQVNQNSAATRAVHDPGHPMADAEGMVHFPATDLVQEMTTLMTASRGYEANVRAFNLLRGMTMKAIEIGAK